MTDKKTPTKKKALNYNDLRKIDVTKHIEKKGKFNYLSWSHAIDELLQIDNDASWEYAVPTTFPDGSMMIGCTVTALGKSRTMQLPVLDFKNQAISTPNAMQINTAMQRCLAKAIACHGIGLHIYHGEDLPPEYEEPKAPEPTPEELAAQKKKVLQRAQQGMIKELKACVNHDELQNLWSGYADDLAVIFEISEIGHQAVVDTYEDKLAGFIS